MSYVETFVVDGRTYGIEDYTKPGCHFFPDQPHQRFRLWESGCGIGQADTIKDARMLLHTYIHSRMRVEFQGHTKRAREAERILEKLGSDPFNLARFKTDA